eukprot:gnl/TRDRNA2_/TRDRNA2_32140_c0_seq1.p1 gnl/TRDRNA2_/TRDRNA2_32140_c0~~gnl/TRDRNA2_/TRDRNA2_32140_c0_seq1.p1  ORF type:complete len:603 (+),score=87.14 gnl/TRDRNA2_/TRDRNA2_32140_c0_seq1:61-1809(+)
MVCAHRCSPAFAVPCSGEMTNANGQSTVDVAIVGAGIQGMSTARRLTEEGLNVVVLERQGHIGGVWNAWANKSSRVQVHEPFYRIGYRENPEDFTRCENVLREMRDAAEKVGALDRVRCGVEVVRVIDEPNSQTVRVLHQSSSGTSDGNDDGQDKHCIHELEELRAGAVIFCTGGLQRPRRVSLPGEDVFDGPVVYGIENQADKLDVKGKRIVVLGMGAFAIENARSALFAGAEHVHVVAHHKNRIFTRLAMAAASSFEYKLERNGDRAKSGTAPSETSPVPGPLASVGSSMVLEPYLQHGARSAMPNAWLQQLDAGGTLNPLRSDSNTLPTGSDVFFIAYALGRLTVHNAEISRLAKGTAVLSTGERLDADVCIKNVGFENPEKGDRMGGICEVIGHRTYRPPMWITERVVCFRSEMKPMDPRDPRLKTDLYNIPASAPTLATINMEIFLHFYRHPSELAKLLNSDEVPKIELSEATYLHHCHGLYAVLKSNASLQAKMDAIRKEMSTNTWKRYSPPGLPLEAQKMMWMHGFLKENREAWRHDCFLLTGDPNAVPFIWDNLLQLMSAQLKMSGRPSSQAAL